MSNTVSRYSLHSHKSACKVLGRYRAGHGKTIPNKITPFYLIFSFSAIRNDLFVPC